MDVGSPVHYATDLQANAQLIESVSSFKYLGSIKTAMEIVPKMSKHA